MPNIIGIGNSQAPINAMLGGLAYQDSVGEINIDKIKARTSDTATAIFVYDTRKDSDGGAWRHRTQKTSWYNEAVSATRGARKEFPAVAVIVAKTDTLIIYDGDDPNLPMWMVFEANTDTQDLFINDSSSALTSVAALNGRVFVGSTRTSTTGNMTGIDFIGDRGGMVYTSSSDIRTYRGGVGHRNDGLGNEASTSNWFTLGNIVNRNVQEVAMTVLPNAPIDATTGLPVPTIALATDGGINVIKNDRNVDTDGSIYGRPFVTQIKFKGERLIGLVHQSGNTADGVLFMEPLNEVPFPEGTDTRYPFFVSSDSALSLDAVDTKGTHPIEVASKNVIAGGNQGIGIIEEKKDSPTNGIIAHISKDFNTGWQHGDIKGAFMSDTDTTNLTDTQAVTNPGPYSNTTGWISDNGFTVTNSNNRLVINSTSNTSSYFGGVHTLTLVSGTKYVLVVNIHSQTQTAVIRLTGNGTYFTSTGLGTGEHAFYFTADQASNSIRIGSDVSGNNRIQEVSSVTIREVEEDRSINDKGLQVFGTVTKSTVAAGAELVAYSGFSGSNYLQQAVNSDLQFGTGDWAFYGWYDDTGGSGVRTIFEIGRDSSAGDHIGVRNDGSNNLELFISDDSFGSQDVAEFSSSAASGWQFSCALRRGNRIELWNNGVLKASTLITNATGDLGDSETYLRFGNRTYTSQPWDGSLALWRVSKSAPSPEQILKMYYDEKCLFQKNAKATLYGTSNNITGLAYDDSNNILHVGTSSGRSEFQGLNRINNTTTAVTTAISASNDLVAEQ